MKTTLTEKRLLAIREALNARLAESIDPTGEIKRKDYQNALEWCRQEISKRRSRIGQAKAVRQLRKAGVI